MMPDLDDLEFQGKSELDEFCSQVRRYIDKIIEDSGPDYSMTMVEFRKLFK